MRDASAARLSIHGAPGGETTVDLSAAISPVSLGRKSDNAVALTWDEEVSRRHARLCWAEGGWAIEDLSSSNGTFVNDVRLESRTPRRFEPGDRLMLGDSELYVLARTG